MRQSGAILLLLAVVGGCSHFQSKPTLQLSIQASPYTNDGGPLYMVVRKTDRASFLTEDYDAVAGALLGTDDPSILKKEIIWPKDHREVRVEKQKADDVLGVYFFYASPGRSWRFAVLDPSVKEMRVRLGAHQIEKADPAN